MPLFLPGTTFSAHSFPSWPHREATLWQKISIPISMALHRVTGSPPLTVANYMQSLCEKFLLRFAVESCLTCSTVLPDTIALPEAEKNPAKALPKRRENTVMRSKSQ
jgi:hypothetical protein